MDALGWVNSGQRQKAWVNVTKWVYTSTVCEQNEGKNSS